MRWVCVHRAPDSCRGSASYFRLPIRAISSALAAALVLMSWFLARSMRTLRMLVGTSRDRAKRDPCWALFGTREAGRVARLCRSTVWYCDRSNELKIPLRFRTSIASIFLCVFSSSSVRSGPLFWLWIHQGSTRARQKQARTLLMVGTVWVRRRTQEKNQAKTANGDVQLLYWNCPEFETLEEVHEISVIFIQII